MWRNNNKDFQQLKVTNTLSDLREDGRLKDGFDDAGVDGQDWENHTGEKHQSQFIHVFHPHKHHQGHERQTTRAINTHVIQHGLGLQLFIFCFKDGSAGQYIRL